MATPPDSPIEEVVYEIEPTRVPKHRPVALEDLCRQTKFTRQEIRVMYRGFKQVSHGTLYVSFRAYQSCTMKDCKDYCGQGCKVTVESILYFRKIS